MRVYIITEETMEADGVDTYVEFSRDNIESVEDILHTFGRALQGMGFSYINTLQAYSDNNDWFMEF